MDFQNYFEKSLRESTSTILEECITQFAGLMVDNGMTTSTKDELVTLWHDKSGVIPTKPKRKKTKIEPTVIEVNDIESGFSYVFVKSKLVQPKTERRLLSLEKKPEKAESSSVNTTHRRIRRNKFGNYMHLDSRIVFDNDTKLACGVQKDDGSVKLLTTEDVNKCVLFGFNVDDTCVKKFSWADECE
jgi:hypothetical protein